MKVNLIVLNSKILEITDSPYYMKKKGNVWKPCSAEDAEIVSVNGEFFNIPGKPKVDEAKDGLNIISQDMGNLILALMKSTDTTYEELMEVKVETKESQGIFYEDINQKIADIEDALCDIDSKMEE